MKYFVARFFIVGSGSFSIYAPSKKAIKKIANAIEENYFETIDLVVEKRFEDVVDFSESVIDRAKHAGNDDEDDDSDDDYCGTVKRHLGE